MPQTRSIKENFTIVADASAKGAEAAAKGAEAATKGVAQMQVTNDQFKRLEEKWNTAWRPPITTGRR